MRRSVSAVDGGGGPCVLDTNSWVLNRYTSGNPTAGCKRRHQGHLPRFDETHEVIQNAVRDVFVENAFVAKLLQVHLEALEFNAKRIGYIRESQGAEVGLARSGTNRRELWADNFDRIITIGKLVCKCLQHFSNVLVAQRHPPFLIRLILAS